jgi:serine phosphatase RsbU (regulator of sigma subunit)
VSTARCSARSRWPETKLELRAGETLVAFTDGVTDTVGSSGERWGATRLNAALAQTHGQTAATIREHLVAELEDFEVGAQVDDTAVVIMRLAGSPSDDHEDLRCAGVGAAQSG